MQNLIPYPALSSNPGAAEYFWHQLPYGIPGLVCFGVGLILIFFALIGAIRDPSRRRLHIAIALTVFGFGALGLVQFFRAVILDRELLLLLHSICYPALMLFAPGIGYVIHELTGRRFKWLAWIIAGTWISYAIGMAGVLQNRAFIDQWQVYFFGQYPRGSLYIRLWGMFGASLGFAGYTALWLHRRRWPEEYRANRLIIISMAAFIGLIQTNLPAVLGFGVYPLGNFGFVPVLVMAYAVFRSDFLSLGDLLFKRNGLFYCLNFLMGITLLTLAIGAEEFLSPAHLAGINWNPWLVITFGSLVAVFLLGILVGGANPGARINQLGSLSLYLTGFLMLAVVFQSIGLEPIVARRLEQLCYILFAVGPAVQFRFAFKAMNQPLPRYTILVDGVCIFTSLFALSPYLFVGYFSYPWGNIGTAGPVIQVFGLMGFLVTGAVTIRWFRARKEGDNPLGRLIVLSVIINAMLMLGNLPATQGIAFYPLANLAILPTGLLAYAVLAHGGVVRESQAVKIGNRISLVVLLVLPIFLYFYFRSLPESVSMANRAMFIALVGAPLMLFGYMVTFLLTRPLAARLDQSYDELEASRAAAENSRDETAQMGEVSRRIIESRDSEEAFQRMTEFVSTKYNVDGIMFFVKDQDRDELINYSARWLDWHTPEMIDYVKNLRIPLDERGGVVAGVYRRGRTCFLPRFPTALDASDPFARLISMLELRSALMIPLTVEGETTGLAFFTDYNKTLKVSKDDIAALERLCHQISGAIQKQELMRELVSSQTEVERLNAFSRLINETTDIGEVLEKIHRFLAPQYKFDGIWIVAVDRENNELVNVNSYGAPPEVREFTENLRVPVTRELGSLAAVIRRKKPLYLSRMPVRLEKMVPFDAELVRHFKAAAILHIPLIVKQEVIGIVCIASYERMHLKPEDIQRINRYCDQIAGALQTLTLLKEVDKEREQSDRLLLNILPEPVAKELKQTGQVEPVLHESVSVMFTDIRGFTRYASEMSPDVLVGELDAVFEQFDNICTRHGLEKLKTIGDAYMCGGGLPRSNFTHPVDVCLAALQFQDFMEQVRSLRRELNEEDFWQIRVGIHTGPVMAGVIGKSKFAYDIWGDAVNVASRMESGGEGGRINVSEDTFRLVQPFFDCTSRGEIDVKNKGRLRMYFLDRIRAEFSEDEAGIVPNWKFKEKYEAMVGEFEGETARVN